MGHKQEKRNELMSVYTIGDQVYIEQKRQMTLKEVNILNGIFSQFIRFTTEQPRKGKQWQN